MAEVKRNSEKTVAPIVIQNLDIRQINRQSQDIGKWRNALRAAESITNPNRLLLYDLYEDIKLDAQLINCTDTRRRKITNSKLQFTDEHGKVVDAVQDVINSEEFFNLLGDLLDTRFYGYSLFNFSMKNGKIKYDLIDRRYVKPKQQIVVKRPSDITGVYYTKPPFDKYTLTAGRNDDLGIYLAAAQYVIYKRGGFGDWAQFAEIFGMPFRIGKYDGHDTTTRAQLNQALETMGSAAYASIPRNTDIDIQQNNSNGNGEVYEKLKNACDEQIAMRMLGQTMTTKDGSSRSQAQVHYEVAEDVHNDDRKFILNHLNRDMRKILEVFGFQLKGGSFGFVDETKIRLKERIEIDDKISKHVILPPEYWFKTYGIDMPDNYEQLIAEKERKEAEQRAAELAARGGLSPSQGNNPNLSGGGGKRVPVRAVYNPPEPPKQFFEGFNPFAKATAKISKADFKAMQKEAKRLATLIYNGELPDNYYVSETMVELIAGHLQQAIESGYGNLASFADNSADAATIRNLKNNVYRFSAAKNYNMLQDMNAALLNNKGERVSLNDFNRAVENLNIEYNRRWQETEYNTAQASSQMAGKYNQYQSEADAVPWLIFRTANDEHVRESHKRLDGMRARANDPLWQKYWPPLDWGCRCDVIQTPGDDLTRKVPGDEEMPKIGKGFEGNAAVTGEIFDKKHPYFKGVPEDVAKKIFG